MKIVIISRDCYPLLTPRAFRTTELAKQFAACGHDVVVYAPLSAYDYSDYTQQTGVVFKNLHKELTTSDSKSNVKTEGVLSKGYHYLLKKYFLYPDVKLIKGIKHAISSENEIDLLVTIAVPHIIHMGASMADLTRVRCWVADCGDPFMGNPFHRPPFYFERLERKWCKRCNFISIPIEEAMNAYYQEYHNKIKIIPQGFDFANTKIADYLPNSRPTFAYSGVFYKRLRDPSLFLEYLCGLEQDFKFVVYTKGTSLIKPYIERLGSKLEIRSYIHREQLILELSRMDFLINIPNNSGVQQPSKLIDYSLTKRPIIKVSSDFTDDEKKTFEAFMQADYSSQQVMKDVDQYNIVNVAEQFLRLVG